LLAAVRTYSSVVVHCPSARFVKIQSCPSYFFVRLHVILTVDKASCLSCIVFIQSWI